MPKPDAATLKTLFGQPPDRAIDYLEQKQLVPSKAWHEIRDGAHNHSFTVANLARIDLLGDIKKSLIDAQKNGTPMEQWREQLIPHLQKKGWWGKDAEGKNMGTPWRLETIYRTNLQSAYMAGRRAEMLEGTDTHPYWRYVAIMDNRTRPTHRALNGRVMRADDPAWDTIFPPCGYNCRCRVSPMTEGGVSRGGYTVESSKGHLSTDIVGLSGKDSANVTVLKLPSMSQPFRVDPGFNSAPGQGVVTQLIKKTEPDIAKAMQDWPVFTPKTATVDDFVKLGKQRLDDLFSLEVTPNRTVKQILDNADSALDYLPHHEKLNRWIVHELKRTRQAGTVEPIVEGSAQGKKIAKKAASVYPADWVKDANNLGVLNVKASQSRGWAWTANKDGMVRLDKFGVVSVKKGEGFLITDDSSTAVHEYGHRIQEARHDLDDLFQQEHRRRTKGEKLQRLRDLTPINYGANEVARPDGYFNPYVGKEYQHEKGREALEVMTMALQPILGSDTKAARFLFDTYLKDRLMIELALGILFHCK